MIVGGTQNSNSQERAQILFDCKNTKILYCFFIFTNRDSLRQAALCYLVLGTFNKTSLKNVVAKNVIVNCQTYCKTLKQKY